MRGVSLSSIDKLIKVSQLDPTTVRSAANKLRVATDVELDLPSVWNSAPCLQHERWQDEHGNIIEGKPKPTCTQCGQIPRKHQRVGASWLFLARKGVLADSVGTGKLQPLHEPVLTPEGWRPIGEIELGDHVIGQDGKPTLVTGVFPQGEKEIVRVHFNDGSWTDVGREHLWNVRADSSSGWKTVTTQQIMDGDTIENFNPDNGRTYQWSAALHRKTGKRRLKIPMCEPVEYPEKVLPIDPYFLGIWLGEGSKQTTTLNSLDALEIAEFTGMELRGTPDKPGATEGKVSPEIVVQLKALGLFGLRSWEKFIPEVYLRGSIEQRLALLQGLMDSDGYGWDAGTEYSTTSPDLAAGVQELAESLGGVARAKTRKSSYRKADGELQMCRDSWRINVKLPAGVMPFRLSRKLEMYGAPTKYIPNRIMDRIEVLPDKQEAVCIKVDNEDGLYLTRSHIVTHNSSTLAMNIGLMHDAGELKRRRVLVITRAPAVVPLMMKLRQVLPGLNITCSVGTKKQRKRTYATRWDVLVIGQQMVLSDKDYLLQFDYAAVIADDVDAIRNRGTATSQAWRELTTGVPRVIVSTATPMQKRLPEMYGVVEQLGGREIFGSEYAFKQRYLNMIPQTIMVKGGVKRRINKVGAVKNLDELRGLLGPMILRRTASDIDDITMPDLVANDVWFDLSTRQRAKYTELQQGILRVINEEKTEIKHAEAMTRFLYGAQICSGLASVGEPDGAGASVKLDWVEEQLTGDFMEDKVIVFVQWKKNLAALSARLHKLGIGHEIIWGNVSDPTARYKSQRNFWDDPNCRVLLGTTAIEQSLDLQVARHLINVDMILNQARMTQLAGRITRDGSAHRTVYVHNLLTADTQEERYLPLLQREAAVSDSIFGTQNELFAPLSARELLGLITP